MRAGSVRIQFSDGSVDTVAVGDVAATLKMSKGAKVLPSKSQEFSKRMADIEPAMGGVAGSMGGAAIGAGLGALTGPFAPIAVPAGAIIGGVAGGAGMGALGQGARELTYQSAGLGDAPGTMSDAAKEQALLGLGGELGGLAMKGLGWGLVRTGIAGKGEAAVRAVAEMLKERIPVGGTNRLSGLVPLGARKIPVIGPSLVRGSEAAGENFDQALAARDRVNAQAGAQGVEIPASAQNQQFRQMKTDLSGRSDRTRQLNALRRRYADFKSVWRSGRLDPSDAQTYLTSLDEEAKSLWEARDKGVHVPRAERIAAQQAKKFSNVLREQMRTLVPGHEVTSKKLSSAIAAQNAVKAAEEHPGVLKMIGRGTIGAGVGSAIGAAAAPNDRTMGGGAGAVLGGLLVTTPSASTRLGLLLTDPYIQFLLRNSPRFIPPGTVVKDQ